MSITYMTSYQRLKLENADLENADLRKKLNTYKILLQKDHFINEWNKRKDKVLSIETPMNEVVFVFRDVKGNFVLMTYIKSAKKVYVDDVFITDN